MNRLSFVAVLALALPAAAADPYPFAVGVTVVGKPMIFIPGLGCDGAVWDGTVAHFKGKYECHVLTLAGFAGQKPTEANGPYLDVMSAGVRRYVADRKLAEPVLVGHSLGATLAMKIGAELGDQAGAVVAVDGFACPIDIFMPGAPAEQAKALVDGIRTKTATATPGEYRKQLHEMFEKWLSGERFEAAKKWLDGSDQATVAKAIGEVFGADLRPLLPKLTAPVLLLGAHSDQHEQQFRVTKDEFERRLKAQMAAAKAATVAVHPKCKHFIMYDEPRWMYETMDNFLK